MFRSSSTAVTVVCPDCGNTVRMGSEDKSCEHQLKLIANIKKDHEHKDWKVK